MSWQYLQAERRGFEKLHHLDVQAAEVTYEEDREVAPWPFCPQLLFFLVNRKGVSPEAVFALLLVLWLWIALTVFQIKVSLCFFSCLHAFFAMVI